MGNNIQLTPAELELIALKRKEAELAFEKKRADRNLRHEKMIKKMENDIIQFNLSNDAINTEVKKLFTELNTKHPDKYKIVSNYGSSLFKETDYYWDNEIEELGLDKYDQFTVTEKNESYIKLSIQRIHTPSIIIVVSYNTVKSGHRSNKELRLFVCGCGSDMEKKALKNVLTAHKNIEDYIETTNRKRSNEEIEKEGLMLLLEYCTTNNPTATCKQVEKYISSNHRNGGYISKKVEVTSPNQLIVSYSVHYYEDTTTKEMVFKPSVSYIDTSKMDQTKLLKILKSM